MMWEGNVGTTCQDAYYLSLFMFNVKYTKQLFFIQFMEGYYVAVSLSITAFALLTNCWTRLIKNTLEWSNEVSIIKSLIFSDIE